jgi:hypothetical protein
MLAAAAAREQALRMRLLRLMYVADPGGGVAPVQRNDAAGSGDALSDAEADDDSDCSDDEEAGGADAVIEQAGVGSSGKGSAGGGVSGGGKQQLYKRRRRQARPPLRGLEQLMDILQLPRNR